MKFEITTKNEDGSIHFTGTANQLQASFLLEVGLNYLITNGAMPLLTGDAEEGVGFAVTEGNETVQ